jgi:hypothetical protein
MEPEKLNVKYVKVMIFANMIEINTAAKNARYEEIVLFKEY